jgi:hypothetical protein
MWASLTSVRWHAPVDNCVQSLTRNLGGSTYAPTRDTSTNKPMGLWRNCTLYTLVWSVPNIGGSITCHISAGRGGNTDTTRMVVLLEDLLLPTYA